jgi:hypothetical protein
MTWQEQAACWHDEMANNLRVRAADTRLNWCGLDISDDDRRANYADARNDDVHAAWHAGCAQALRSMRYRTDVHDLTPLRSDDDLG